MKKLFLPLIIVASITTSCIIVKGNDGKNGTPGYSYSDNDQTIQTGQTETKSFSISNFEGVKVSQGIRVEIVKSNVEKAVATSNLMQYLRVEVKGGVANVYYEFPKNTNNNTRNADTKVVIYAKNLDNLQASSAGKIVVKDTFDAQKVQISTSSASSVQYNVNANSLKLNQSSASSFTGTINVKSLDVDLSSAATSEIDGKADIATVRASSASNLIGKTLSANTVNADASSGAKITVGVNSSLTARASSGGSVRYRSGSSVQLNVSKSSGGSVDKI